VNSKQKLWIKIVALVLVPLIGIVYNHQSPTAAPNNITINYITIERLDIR
jgi:hypothetical protein